MRKLYIVLIGVLAAFFLETTAKAELFLSSTLAFDQNAGTVTLPLYKGNSSIGDVYYIITESSDFDSAHFHGVNYSPKLANALDSAAVQNAIVQGGVISFPGSVDFSPQRQVIPGPDGFPPLTAIPGSVGDTNYSPLVTTDNTIVLNAPHVANGTGLHDSVASIDTVNLTVTMKLVPGFYRGDPILYISTEVSDFATAALEEATFAPNLNSAPGLASGDPQTSARAAIIPIVNGPVGPQNPERQGLTSALLGEGGPLNIVEIHPRNQGSIPTYSPLWDVHPAIWTDEAIVTGEQTLIDHHEDIIDGIEDGFITSGGMGPTNPELGGLRAAGFIVNCPIISID